ncbi:MAG: hypothetical protein V3V01_00515 [Acidimicrobiales bacterium]
MTHMVIFQTSQQTTHHRCDDISSAVEMMERLRNEDGVESLELFELNEVEFEFRTYYHVAIASQDEQSEPASGSIESLYASSDEDDSTQDDVDQVEDSPSNVTAFPTPEPVVEDELLEPLAPLTDLVPPSEPAESSVAEAEVAPLPPITASVDSSSNDEGAEPTAATPFSDAIAANSDAAVAAAPQSADDIFGAVASSDEDAELPPPPPPPEFEEPAVQEQRRGLFGR